MNAAITELETGIVEEIKDLLNEQKVAGKTGLAFFDSQRNNALHCFCPIKSDVERYDSQGNLKKQPYSLWDRNSTDPYIKRRVAEFTELVQVLSSTRPVIVPTEIEVNGNTEVVDMEYFGDFDFKENRPLLLRRFPMKESKLGKLKELLARAEQSVSLEPESILAGAFHVN